MSDDALSEFIDDIYLYLDVKSEAVKCREIQKNSLDVAREVDLSFEFVVCCLTFHSDPVDFQPPKIVPPAVGFENEEDNKELPFCRHGWKEEYTKFTELVLKMKEASANWNLKIERCEITKNRVNIFLDRKFAFRTALAHVLRKGLTYGCNAKKKSKGCVIQAADSQLGYKDLSQLRVQYLKTFAIKIAKLSGFDVLEERQSADDLALFLTTKSSTKVPDNMKGIVCGTVVNAKSKTKETKILADEYKRLRINDMKTAAIHKYGDDVINDERQNRLTTILGEAAVRMELLQVKTSQVVSLNLEPEYIASRENSCKGAVFILYNYTRISSILKLFKVREEKSIYPAAVPVAEIDFSLLQHEDEWTLLQYILVYPSVLETLTKEIEMGQLKPQILCLFLNELSQTFSRYYRSVRILSDPKSHLMPLMFARVYLLMGLEFVIQSALNLLGIDAVTQM